MRKSLPVPVGSSGYSIPKPRGSRNSVGANKKHGIISVIKQDFNTAFFI